MGLTCPSLSTARRGRAVVPRARMQASASVLRLPTHTFSQPFLRRRAQPARRTRDKPGPLTAPRVGDQGVRNYEFRAYRGALRAPLAMRPLGRTATAQRDDEQRADPTKQEARCVGWRHQNSARCTRLIAAMHVVSHSVDSGNPRTIFVTRMWHWSSSIRMLREVAAGAAPEADGPSPPGVTKSQLSQK